MIRINSTRSMAIEFTKAKKLGPFKGTDNTAMEGWTRVLKDP